MATTDPTAPCAAPAPEVAGSAARRPASLEDEQLMSARLAKLVRRTVEEREKAPHMSEHDRFWWRRTKTELVIARLEPSLAIEEKYPHDGPDAAQVQERQPWSRLQRVGDALTVTKDCMIVVLCKGI